MDNAILQEITKKAHQIHLLNDLIEHMPHHAAKLEGMLHALNKQLDELIEAVVI